MFGAVRHVAKDRQHQGLEIRDCHSASTMKLAVVRRPDAIGFGLFFTTRFAILGGLFCLPSDPVHDGTPF